MIRAFIAPKVASGLATPDEDGIKLLEIGATTTELLDVSMFCNAH
jgi:hypothetical protein